MEIGFRVEERRWRELIPHGAAAGILAGIGLALVQIGISAARGESWLAPAHLAASLVLGPGALMAGSSMGLLLIVLVGVALHFLLAALFGILFLALLSFAYQLSARAWVLALYGVLFGFLLWEINFLAIVPIFDPFLRSRLGLSSQLWRGIVAYSLVYGPGLSLYLIRARPGVLASWRR